MEDRTFRRIFILVPFLVILFFVYKLFQPFLMPLCLAMIAASLCYPVYSWIRDRLGHRPNLAALMTCIAVTLVIILPCVGLVISLAGQASDVYRVVQDSLESGRLEELSRIENLPYLGPGLAWAKETLGSYLGTEDLNLVQALAGAMRQVSLFLIRQSTAILGGIASLITNFFLMIVTMFFLLRDGAEILAQLKTFTPLSPRTERLILQKLAEVTQATVLGSLVTAIAQGMAGGIVFALLGIPQALLWGSLMALSSLIPLVGTSLVWLPWAIYLFSTGQTVKGIILVVVSVFFIGMIDNILRPLFIEGKVRMPTLLIFFSIMGGISYMGLIGVILGPILVALALTFLELYKLEYKDELVKVADEDEAVQPVDSSD